MQKIMYIRSIEVKLDMLLNDHSELHTQIWHVDPQPVSSTAGPESKLAPFLWVTTRRVNAKVVSLRLLVF